MNDLPEDLINILKEIQDKSSIKLFKKYNNMFILRDINKIKIECHRMKRKIVMNYSNDLKNLSNNNIELYKLKEMQEIINKNIHEIDNLMNIINENNYITNLNNHFIEIYEN
jgi:hypothetical protein